MDARGKGSVDLPSATYNVLQRQSLQVRRFLPRRPRVFGVGAPKTGTTSIAGIFSGYRSFHEADASAYVALLAERWPIARSDPVVTDYLTRRDQRYRPEVDSASMNGVCCHLLVRLAPDARFILTVRHPIMWLGSIANHVENRSGSLADAWVRYRDARFGSPDPPPEEARFRALWRYPVHGYLRYWKDHNLNVLDSVPSSQLLVIPTDDITAHIPEMAAFAGASPRRVSGIRSHRNKAARPLAVLDYLPEGYLQDAVEEVCGDVLRALPLPPQGAG